MKSKPLCPPVGCLRRRPRRSIHRFLRRWDFPPSWTPRTNALLIWIPAYGAAVNYVIERGVLNPANGIYSYSTIGTVSSTTSSFTDNGAITTANSRNNKYEVEAVYARGAVSQFALTPLAETYNSPRGNIYVTANLIRNQTGRWQVIFSGLSTNTTPMVQLLWMQDNFVFEQQNIWTANLTNNVYQIPDADVLYLLSQIEFGVSLAVQPIGPNGELGEIVQAGLVANDAPYFVDGRAHMKQNLNFLIRAASMNHLFFIPSNAADGQFIQNATNFEEFSFLHQNAEGSVPYTGFCQLDNLWPFAANYEMANYLADTSRTFSGGVGPFPYGWTNFTFQPNFATNIPAPAVLNQADPYWILQPGFTLWFYGFGGPPGNWGLSVSPNETSASLAGGIANLFSLPYYTGSIVGSTNNYGVNPNFTYQELSPGGNVTTPSGYLVSYYASWCPAPTLVFSNYYFAPLIYAHDLLSSVAEWRATSGRS